MGKDDHAGPTPGGSSDCRFSASRTPRSDASSIATTSSGRSTAWRPTRSSTPPSRTSARWGSSSVHRRSPLRAQHEAPSHVRAARRAGQRRVPARRLRGMGELRPRERRQPEPRHGHPLREPEDGRARAPRRGDPHDRGICGICRATALNEASDEIGRQGAGPRSAPRESRVQRSLLSWRSPWRSRRSWRQPGWSLTRSAAGKRRATMPAPGSSLFVFPRDRRRTGPCRPPRRRGSRAPAPTRGSPGDSLRTDRLTLLVLVEKPERAAAACGRGTLRFEATSSR